jgi:hypothetical protein
MSKIRASSGRLAQQAVDKKNHHHPRFPIDFERVES